MEFSISWYKFVQSAVKYELQDHVLITCYDVNFLDIWAGLSHPVTGAQVKLMLVM